MKDLKDFDVNQKKYMIWFQYGIGKLAYDKAKTNKPFLIV